MENYDILEGIKMQRKKKSYSQDLYRGRKGERSDDSGSSLSPLLPKLTYLFGSSWRYFIAVVKSFFFPLVFWFALWVASFAEKKKTEFKARLLSGWRDAVKFVQFTQGKVFNKRRTDRNGHVWERSPHTRYTLLLLIIIRVMIKVGAYTTCRSGLKSLPLRHMRGCCNFQRSPRVLTLGFHVVPQRCGKSHQ